MRAARIIGAAVAMSGLLTTASSATSPNYTFTTIDAPGASGEGTVANGINNNAEIVGYFPDNTGAIHGFIYTNGVFSQIDVPGAAFTEAFDINNIGQIVGAFFPESTGASHGFLFSAGSFKQLDVPGALNTDPKGLNDSGQIVGNFTSGGTDHGFLYSNGVFNQIDVPGAVETEAWGINNSGQIVGEFFDDNFV